MATAKYEQISINFEATPVDAYGSLVEYCQALVHQDGRPMKAIAAEMDLAPSALSRKLTQSPDDSMRLTVDNLERLIEILGPRPIHYLFQKHSRAMTEDEIDHEIALLQAKKNSLSPARR